MLSAMRAALLLIAAGLLFPAMAMAQETAESEGEPTPDQLAEARELFEDGLRYASEGLFGRAEIAFRRAAAIKAAPPVLYNLASAQYELGELVEAGTNAQLVLADGETPPELAESARALLQQVHPRVGRLTVQIAGAADTATVDGEALEDSQLGRALIVEAGTRTIAGMRDGETVTERTIDLEAGAQAYVDVTVVPTAAETAAAAETTAAAVEDDGGHLLNRSQLGLVIGASGLLLTILTAIVVFVAAG